MSTVRKNITSFLYQGEWTAREISQAQRIAEKEVYDHLEHIKLSEKSSFRIKPAECLGCGFRFTKRDTVKPPSRCPLCRCEHIQDPVFYCERI
jgi:hypothetical protein